MRSTDWVDLPASDWINTGLSVASEKELISLFGVPGKLTTDCSPVTNKTFEALLVTDYVHPKKFRVTGLREAVVSLKRIFTEMEKIAPSAFASIGTAGMLCVRRIRGGANYSKHSWGIAIDFTFGGELTPLGSKRIQRGLMDIYGLFRRSGWYWGAGFSRPDAMHFEVSREKLFQWYGHH